MAANPAFVLPFGGLDFNAIADNLQGNTLKSHGRNFANHVFVTFKNDAATRTAVKNLIRKMANDGKIISTRKQFSDSEEFKRNGTQFLFTGIYISKFGYDYLLNGNATLLAKVPADASFKRGMKAPATKTTLNDPSPAQWEATFNRDIHVMFLLAHAKSRSLSTATSALKAKLKPLTQNPNTDIFVQSGKGMKNKAKDHVEHFGYVDGISQPVFLQEDLNEISNWNPSASLSQLIIPDPLGKVGTNSFGSYFVFRKLEQNVRGFKKREETLADELGFVGVAKELAGAMVVGRFENGMPVTMSDEDDNIGGVVQDDSIIGKINNFNYSADAAGAKCPFHSHIRKTNPRGSGGFETPVNEEAHLFARRGITYGRRKMDILNPEVLAEAEINKLPTRNVGLLFMCLNVNIGNQFEFMQKQWANSDGFPAGGPHGIDPVIGQNPSTGNQRYATEWDNAASIIKPNGFQNFVTMKGGEYFFTPSISFLQSL